jgi:DNA-binding CsgD family transcriptional regulator
MHRHRSEPEPHRHRRRASETEALTAFAATRALTPAELGVLTLLLDGKTPSEIAATRGVAISTVRTHLKRLFAKTGTRRQADLVRCALRGS